MRQWTITKKLVFLCGCFLANICIVQIVGHTASNSLSEWIDDFSDVELPATRSMALADMMHDGLRGVVYRAIVASQQHDKNAEAEVRNELKEMSDEFHKHLDELNAMNLDSSVKKSLADARPDLDAYIEQASMVTNLAFSGKFNDAMNHLDSFQKAFEKLEGSLGAIGDKIEKKAKEALTKSDETQRSAHFLGYLILALSLVLGVINGWWIIRDISVQLRAIMTKLSAEASHLTVTADQVSQTSTTLSTASTRQAEALQETASAIEEMSSMIKKTSENAEESRQVSTTSQQTAERGQQKVTEMIGAIREINASNEAIGRQINESNRQISEITKVINEIGSKTKVINDIVFQTKLLSFNASVEAARAGEHGKGFAVVAEEVGNLAQMSGNAAKEISDMLSASISRVEGIVNQTKSEIERLMSQNKSKVESGTTIAQECSRVLGEMVKSASEVAERVNAISSATSEQATGVAEITKAMNQLDQITHSNSSVSQQAQAASSELNGQARNLLEVIQQLEALAGGNQSSQPRETAAPSSGSDLESATPAPKLKAFGKPSAPNNVPARELFSRVQRG